MSGLTPEFYKRMQMTPELRDCERTIERGIYAYASAGWALAQIRDNKLYKEDGYKSFESYCRERWGWSRASADRQIQAAGIHDALYELSEGKTADHGQQFDPPRSERTARELVPLREKPEQLAEVWTKVVEEHGPDAEAKHVRKVVAESMPKKEPAKPPEPEERSVDDAVLALRRMMDRGYTVEVLRKSIDLIDPGGKVK